MQPAVSAICAEQTQPAPVLLGETGPKEILKISDAWSANYESYEPSEETVARIRAVVEASGKDLRIDVVYGSWCGDSREQVPKFLKIENRLGRWMLQATYLAVGRDKKTPPEAVEGKGIEKVPTFIVMRKGAEIGRIVETPKASMESDLLEILAKAK